MEREREEASATPPAVDPPPTPKIARAPKPRPAKTAPTELDSLEGQIASVEARIAELERRLADDWSDMDVLGAHRAARDELVALLERWEVVFGEAQTT
jgi:hypothetical protein